MLLVQFSQLQDQAQGEVEVPIHLTTDAVREQAAENARCSASRASCLCLGGWKMNYRDKMSYHLWRVPWVIIKTISWCIIHPRETLDTSNAASAEGLDKWRMGWLYQRGS